jgi:flagellar basal-body rod modification protein FlgD
MSITGGTVLQSINADAFLKLFITQLQHQDPTQPMDASQMLGQLAQLTSVQKMTEMSETFQAAYQTERLALAKGLIGSEVTFLTGEGLAQGIVDGAVSNDGQVGVTVDGCFVDLDKIQGIRAQSAEATQGA